MPAGWCCTRAGSTSTSDTPEPVVRMDAMTQQTLPSDLPDTTIPVGRTSIVPADSIAGRALVAVVAIMTFLAAFTLGAVVLVRAAAGEWQSAVARGGTLPGRPLGGRGTHAPAEKAAGLRPSAPRHGG